MRHDRGAHHRSGGDPGRRHRIPRRLPHRRALLGLDRGVPRGGLAQPPGFDASTSSTSEPVLAPDGSLRVVGSRPARGDCTYELYASEPGAAALTASARVTTPLRGRARSDCRSSLRTWSDSWVEVNDPEFRAATVWFVRDGDAWTSTTEDASGLAQIDVRGCCDTYAAGFIHWNSVARLARRTADPGAEPPARGRAVERAGGARRRSPTSRCTSLNGFEAGPKGYALVLSCRGGVAVAASADLRDWTSTYLPGVTGEALPGDEGLRIGGELVWTPGSLVTRSFSEFDLLLRLVRGGIDAAQDCFGSG